MTAVTFSDILGFGLGFGGCGLVNITGLCYWNWTYTEMMREKL